MRAVILPFKPRHDPHRPQTCMCEPCQAARQETKLLATYPNGLMLVEWHGERRVVSIPAV